MAQRAPPSTGRDTDDALMLASRAVASLTTQGAGATTRPLWPSVADPLSYNPWGHMARSTMPSPSLNTAATLPSRGAQHNCANTAKFDVPTPQQNSHPPQHCGSHDESEVELPGTNGHEPAKVPQETEPVGADAATAESEEEDSSDDLSDVQINDESESRMSSESDADLDRQDRYAFNYASQAYDHRVPQNLTGGTTLFAEKVCMGTLIQQHLESADKQGKSGVCPNLVPHELEMTFTPKAVECIWVGMLPAVLQPGGDDAAEKQSKGMPKTPNKGQKKAKKVQSVISLEDDQLDIIPHDPNALRVVAKKQAKPVKLWHLYALTTSDNGSKLCQGWKVPFEEVFVFKAFRDDTAAGLMKRRHATDLKIKAVIFPPDPLPAVVLQASPGANNSTSPVSAPVSPTTGNLPSPEPSGRKGKSSRTLREATTKQAPKDGNPLVQEGDQARNPADSVEGGNSAVAEKQSSAGVEPRDLGTVDDDEGEDAYPEYAVSSENDTYKDFLDNMVRELAAVEPEGVKLGQKRKRVAFDPSCDEVANTRRKTGGSSRSNTQARDGENDGAEPSSFVVAQQTDYLGLKLKSIVNKLEAKQDVAGLRQCVTLMGCIEERGNPSHTSALAPYLSISSKRDADPRACNGKLREILDLFPNLEKVDGLDSHVLAFMVHGLRVTGQSIEIGLIEPCIQSYSRIYKQKFGNSRPAKMAKGDLIDMICQARDDAEKMHKKAPLNKMLLGEPKKS